MRSFSILILVFLLAICTFSLAILVHDELSEAGTTSKSLDVPVRPAEALRNINVALNNRRVQDPFNPPQLYLNIYLFLITLWKAPGTESITRVRPFHTFPPDLRTLIEPAAGSTLFKTEVAASALLRLLSYLTTLDLSPRSLAVTLTTRATRSRLIGTIKSGYMPPPGSNSVPSVGTEKLPSDNSTTTMSLSDSITTQIDWDGQGPSCPAMTPQTWLESFTGVSGQIFAQHLPDEKISITQPQTIFTYQKERTSRCFLQSQVNVAAVPAGELPLEMKELVAALTTVLQATTQTKNFELFHAHVYKDGWLAAIFKLYYILADGNSATA
ncbi:MAG: hypothetical protein L6R41_002056 [Letrouitia leprolyta]|nr:MAG: hypothetical protein L6R41_002056 [Letrouitia leprolyta]